jgi:predicted secreted Zn-dependent protease
VTTIRRLAVLTAVGLLSACGGSSPGPETAPTPAPAAAPALPRVSITGREQYYDIDGTSAGALREGIRRLGPKDASGTSLDALTVWNLQWTYKTVPVSAVDSSCALQDLKVTLDVTVTLPRWTPPASASASLRESWRTYLQHVRVHEAGHRAIAERNAADLYRALLGLRAATCAQLDSQASRTGEDTVADGRARNRAYDAETKHGQTQGVVLGP